VLAAALVASGRHLRANLLRLRDAYPVRHATAFGNVDYAGEAEAGLSDRMATLLADAGSRTLYGYPILADLYLTVPADNPTRYGFFFYSDYHTPAEVQEVLDVLAARRVPYVVVLPDWLKPDDPILAFVIREYEPTSPTFAGRVIYRLKQPAGSAPRRADEEDVGDAPGRGDEPALGQNLEVSLEDTPLRRHRPDVLAAIPLEQEPLQAIRGLRVEVEDDEAASHHPGKAGEDPVGDRVREVMERARHDGGVEALLLRHVLEANELEATARPSPAPAREGDVVGVEVDTHVFTRDPCAESAATTRKVEHAFRRGRGERRHRLAQRACPVEHRPTIVEQDGAQRAADGCRAGGRHAGALYQPGSVLTTGGAPRLAIRSHHA
jgi:hypothetical protein